MARCDLPNGENGVGGATGALAVVALIGFPALSAPTGAAPASAGAAASVAPAARRPVSITLPATPMPSGSWYQLTATCTAADQSSGSATHPCAYRSGNPAKRDRGSSPLSALPADDPSNETTEIPAGTAPHTAHRGDPPDWRPGARPGAAGSAGAAGSPEMMGVPGVGSRSLRGASRGRRVMGLGVEVCGGQADRPAGCGRGHARRRGGAGGAVSGVQCAVGVPVPDLWGAGQPAAGQCPGWAGWLPEVRAAPGSTVLVP
jgi:hypothetical protein